ncbi:hypothetical protein KJ765_05780 [Candidatus Micrarchaeota archaeon]|nr:hypothetical protein [Candidatus Micrarchaeota archaeon]
MEAKFERIVKVLEDLLREEDVLAVRIASASGGSIGPPQSLLKIKDMGVWNMVNNTVNEAFTIFTKFGPYGIDKMYLELGEYEIIFFRVDRRTLLIAVIPTLANKGLLEVEIENTRRETINILKSSGPEQ